MCYILIVDDAPAHAQFKVCVHVGTCRRPSSPQPASNEPMPVSSKHPLMTKTIKISPFEGVGVHYIVVAYTEAPTQVFLFVLRTFVHDEETVQRLQYLGYDRACDLKPFLQNQSRRGSAGAKLLLEQVKFLVDIP